MDPLAWFKSSSKIAKMLLKLDRLVADVEKLDERTQANAKEIERLKGQFEMFQAMITSSSPAELHQMLGKLEARIDSLEGSSLLIIDPMEPTLDDPGPLTQQALAKAHYHQEVGRLQSGTRPTKPEEDDNEPA